MIPQPSFKILAVLAFALVFVLAHYAYLLVTQDGRRALDQQNEMIRLKLKAIEKDLAQVKSLSQKLLALTSFTNGAESDQNVVTLSLDSLKSREAQQIESQLLSEKTELLAEETRRQIISLGQLIDYFQDRDQLRSVLPSIHPLKGVVTSPFGVRSDPYSGEPALHAGIDIAAREGTVIVAPAFGRVIFSSADNALGNLLVIDHGLGYQTQYGHLKEALVQIGDTVERGQPIAQVGNTGKSTGPHLHYEIRKFGIPVNPMQYMID